MLPTVPLFEHGATEALITILVFYAGLCVSVPTLVAIVGYGTGTSGRASGAAIGVAAGVTAVPTLAVLLGDVGVGSVPGWFVAAPLLATVFLVVYAVSFREFERRWDVPETSLGSVWIYGIGILAAGAGLVALSVGMTVAPIAIPIAGATLLGGDLLAKQTWSSVGFALAPVAWSVFYVAVNGHLIVRLGRERSAGRSDGRNATA